MAGTPRIGRMTNLEPLVKEPEAPIVNPVAAPEAAADLLISYLPDVTQEMFNEAAQTLAIPRWHLLLGYVMRIYDHSEMFSPFVLDSWSAGGRPNTERPCGSCQRLFKSRFPDAKYCCAPCFFDKLNEQGHADDCPTMGG